MVFNVFLFYDLNGVYYLSSFMFMSFLLFVSSSLLLFVASCLLLSCSASLLLFFSPAPLHSSSQSSLSHHVCDQHSVLMSSALPWGSGSSSALAATSKLSTTSYSLRSPFFESVVTS